jgi:hypothetical protein
MNPGTDFRCSRCGMPAIEAGHLHAFGAILACDECKDKIDPPDLCDFCGIEKPLWLYQTGVTILRGVLIEEEEVQEFPDIVMEEGWAACDRCNPFVKQRDIFGLAERIADTKAVPAEMNEQFLTLTRLMLVTVFRGLKEPATRFERR